MTTIDHDSPTAAPPVQPVAVAQPQAQPQAQLAYTGFDLELFAGLGTVMLLAGGLLVAHGRRAV